MVLTWEKIMMQFISNNTSLVSGCETVPIIDLGHHGFADSFYPIELKDMASKTVPLVCCLDKTTGLVQLQNITVAKDRYDIVDYSYTSSNSHVSREHWNEFFNSVKSKISLQGGYILEIGSNDGYLLSLFKQITNNVTGVDASTNMVAEANSRGIDTVHGIFGESEELNPNIGDVKRKFDAILANNVLNHANNPLKFVKEISLLLNRDGVFIFEVPYWYNTISSLRFDQIYLEHITYFTVESLEFLLSTVGLYINEVELIDYHGGSLRIYASFKEEYSLNKSNFLALENKLKLKDEITYFSYMNKINQVRDRFLKNLIRYRNEKPASTIFGIGAAAKANTLLTYYGLNSQNIEFIVDSSPFKQGKITPVSLIPIVDDQILARVSNGVGIILAWNLSNNLKDKLRSINKSIRFLDIM
jgi:SAM-dependent methyltransferase